jgi:hypothetical protein
MNSQIERKRSSCKTGIFLDNPDKEKEKKAA